MRNAARSARSPRCRRQSRAAPLATSIRLSKPKPTSATLPARNPASKATRASRLFHAMVKYSRRWADLRNRFFEGRDPIGKFIEIEGNPYEVVGAAKALGSVFGNRSEEHTSELQ